MYRDLHDSGIFFNNTFADFRSPYAASVSFGANSILYTVSSFAMRFVMEVRERSRINPADGVTTGSGLTASDIVGSIGPFL